MTADDDLQTVNRANHLSVPQSWMINLIVGSVMGFLWGVFAYRHLIAFSATKEWLYLIMCVSETLTAVFFLVRSAPATVSTRPLDWAFAIGGTFMPLFFMPHSSGLLPLAEGMMLIGMCLQVVSLISLNRSFALVAAKREIKTKGMYSIVRHPLYASYWLIFTGYLLTNTSWTNVSVYVITMGLLGARALREELHLAADPAYSRYMHQVRYRIVPFVF